MADPDESGSDIDLSIREPPKILIPVEVLAGQTIPESLVEFLSPSEIVVLGYHVLPEQTSTEQASMQFEERAQTAVDDIAHAFEEAGRDIETRVVFTHDRDQTVERVAQEVEATALLLPNPTGEIENILVTLRGAIEFNRLTDLVFTLIEAGETSVTLWGLTHDESEFDPQHAVEEIESVLLDRGFRSDQVTTETSLVETPIYEIIDRSGEFDLIMMGEGEQSVMTAVFGDDADRVAEGAVSPVLVVRTRETDI